MFSRFFNTNRSGRSFGKNRVVVVAVAAAVTAMAGITMAAGKTSSKIIYRDNFTGSKKLGTLNGSKPTVDNGPSATWIAPTSKHSGWSAGGYFNANTPRVGRSTAMLKFTPKPGHIYTLSATVSLTKGANSAAYLAIGFLSSVNRYNLTYGWDLKHVHYGFPSASPWALARISDGNATYFTGPGLAGGGGFSIPKNGNLTNNTLTLVLNTKGKTWTYQVYDNGKLGSGDPIALPAKTQITAVGMQGASAVGRVSNFELTSR